MTSPVELAPEAARSPAGGGSVSDGAVCTGSQGEGPRADGATPDAATSDAGALKDRGNALFAAGDYAGALAAYEAAIGADADVAVFYSNAAACCLRLGEHGRAAVLAEEAIRRDATMGKAYYRRGCALMALCQWRDALADLQRVAAGATMPSAEVRERMRTCERELQKIAFARAIHVDVFELSDRHIDALPALPETYAGPRLEAGDVPDAAWTRALVSFFREERRLPPRVLYRVLLRALDVLCARPNVVNVDILGVAADGAASDAALPTTIERATIVGDVHGQFFDLAHMLDANGWPSETHAYVFNGDIVDRGPCSVEVAVVLLALVAAFPASVFVGRGNHEAEGVNRMHGFWEEVRRKYPGEERMFTLFNTVLHALPVAHVVARRYFVVHGGLPRDGATLALADIAGINRRVPTPEPGSVLSQLLWSDPQDRAGIAPSHRGEGVLFGPDVTDAFLRRNGLRRLVRSHVWEADGWREHHGGRCVTVFSAPNYTGTVSPGAVINISRVPEGRVRTGRQPAPASRQHMLHVSVDAGLRWEVWPFDASARQATVHTRGATMPFMH